MEQFTIVKALTGSPIPGKRVVCGVVGSGNLEVIVEPDATKDAAKFVITTSVPHYQVLWSSVIEAFVNHYKPVGLSFTINDNGAAPPTVALRLRQAFERFQGYEKIGNDYLELDARHRIASLLDKDSFKEWLADKPYYSPHLSALDISSEADDGLVIGVGLISGQRVLIAAQQKDFLGGAVGEIHGAKLTGLFKQAIALEIATVILLIDSGGVRLQEANAGEIGISETIRAIFAARAKGVITMGVICGKNGAYGGMGIISTCLDYLLVDEIGRTGVSGAEVIQTVKGVEAFDAADRPLIWRVYGGKTRFLQHIADCFVDGSIQSIRQALIHRLELGAPVETLLEQARCQQRLLQRRVDSTQGCQDEGEYLTHLASPYADTLFEMHTADFLEAAASLRGSSPLKGDQ